MELDWESHQGGAGVAGGWARSITGWGMELDWGKEKDGKEKE